MNAKRRPVVSGQSSALLCLAIIFSLLLTSVVYACSGLRLLHVNSHHVEMSHESVERGPCSESKEDICKSVRDRMLSLQPRSSQAEDLQLFSVISLQLAVEPILSKVPLSAASESKWLYDPLLQSPLSVAFPLLRI